jgi:hypothetical protein
MPLDIKSLKEGGTPRAEDGRTYPDYLQHFEDFDDELLAQVEQLGQPTLNQLALNAADAKMRSVVSPWLSSAEWRGLIDRVKADEMAGTRRYKLTSLGKKRLRRS